MTILVALSIAFVAFIVGFVLGLMGIALAGAFRREVADHDSCVLRADQYENHSAGVFFPLQRR